MCIVFTKLASQLTAEKLTDLAIIPAIFIVMTAVSYLCSSVISRVFRFKKRQANFVTAMAVRSFLSFGVERKMTFQEVSDLWNGRYIGIHFRQN